MQNQGKTGGGPERAGELDELRKRLRATERRLRDVEKRYQIATAQIERSEADLRRSEERYALATSAAVEGIYEWDLDAGTLFLTERAKTFFAITGEDLTPAAWNVRIHAEDYPGYRAALVDHFKGRAPHLELEYRIADDRGRYRWILDRGIGVRDANGRVVRLVGALSDITERKRAENELRRARDRAEDALERQTATSAILAVISSSPTDVKPVYEAIVERARQLCEATFSGVVLVDGHRLVHVAARGLDAGATTALRTSFPQSLGRDSAAGRAILERRVVHIDDVRDDPEYRSELAASLGIGTILAVPMLRADAAIGAICVWRDVVRPFSPEQIALLQAFADQAVIAIHNVRLFDQLQARNHELTEALEQQTATSEILRVISRSQTDVQPVFDTIAAAALNLCAASTAVVTKFDGTLIHVAALANLAAEGAEAVHRIFPRPPSHANATTRAIQTSSVVAIPDISLDSDYDDEIESYSVKAGFRSALAVPLMHDGDPIGAITVGRPIAGAFSDKQVSLLQTFADQAVIAIQNARLFNELDARNRDLIEALERQTATSDILRVISQSPRDVQPVFDTIAPAALKLCRASSALVFTFDGKLIELAAAANLNPEGTNAWRDAFPRPPSRDTAATRAVLTGNVVAIPDVLEDPEYTIGATAASTGFRSALAVPLIREGKPIGVIGVGRPEPGSFPDGQIALLQTFADQAVIAIENVRLFNELEARNRDLTEALEQQTATSDILRVMSSSPRDVQPVFDTIAAAALKLCAASSVIVTTLDGEMIRLSASANITEETGEAMRRRYPRPRGRDTATARAIETRAVVTIPDVLADAEYDVANASLQFRSTLGVPLLRDGSPMGAIGIGRAETGPYSEKQIALLQTFADQAVIAIENVRLFTELEARSTDLARSVRELKALGEVGQAVSSTLDLETVLRTIVSRATKLAGMDGGAIYEYDEAREQFHLRATDKLPGELVEALRVSPIPKGEGALGKLAVAAEPVEIRDIVDDRGYQSRVRDMLIRLGYRSLLALPLLREQHLLGGLIVNRCAAGEFAPDVIDLLKTFATQSALAIQNARLFREIEQKSRELEAASQHKSEFLANMSHELRTPLNAIIGFSEVLAERMFGDVNEKQAEYVRDIHESGQHLLSLINDILDLSKIEAGRMELEASDFDLPSVIENALILVRERAVRRGIAVGRSIDDRLGAVHADERKVKQVLLNLLSNALKFTAEGGRIDVHAAIRGGAAEISVTDTGVGIAPQDHEAVFEEFRQVGMNAKKVEGTGLGLAISRKFIELHGGRIWVKSELGSGSTFTFTLPLPLR